MFINYGSCVVSLSHSSVPLYTLTVITTPVADHLDLNTEGYEQVLNTITVPLNTEVICEAEKTGYVLYREIITVTGTETKQIALEPGVLFTINTTPADAEVIFTIDGYTYPYPFENNTIYAPIGRPFSYTISKENYETQSATITVTEPTTLSITLKPFTPLDLSNYLFDIDSKHDVTLIKYIGNEADITVPVTNDNN